MPVSNSNQKNPFESKFKIGDIVVVLFFTLSLIMGYFGIQLYRNTIIRPRDLILPMLFAGIVFAILLPLLKTSWAKAWSIVEGFVGGACIAYFTVLYINLEYRHNELIIEEFTILRHGNLPQGRKSKCGSPYAEIDFWGVKKDLIFPCTFEKTLKKHSKLKLTYAEGKLGYEVILEKLPLP